MVLQLYLGAEKNSANLPQMSANIFEKIKHRWQLISFRPGTYQRNLYGISLTVFTNSLFSKALFGPSRTDWKEIRFIKEHLIAADDVVCDVGANVGFTTMYLSKCATNVIAYGVEPNPLNLEAFYRNIDLNRLEGSVFVIPNAAGSVTGEKIRLTVHPNSSVATATEKQKTYETTIVSLDQYFESSGKKFPTVLKVDVEGAELGVLEGARKILSQTPKLAVEIHVINFNEPVKTITSIFELINLQRYQCYIQPEVDGEIIPFNFSQHSPEQLSRLINVHLFCIPK